MQKGAFTGKKLSDLKPKDETPQPTAPTLEPAPLETPQRPAVSSQAVHKEAQNRLERFLKENLALDILNRGPKEVRAATLGLLSQTIATTASETDAARLSNVRQELTRRYPLENPDATLDAFFDYLTNEVIPNAPEEFKTMFMFTHAIDLPSELLEPLKLRIAAIIASDQCGALGEDYKKVLERLRFFEASMLQIQNATKHNSSATEKAQALLDTLAQQPNFEQEFILQTSAQRFYLQQITKAIAKAPKDVIAPLARLILDEMNKQETPQSSRYFLRPTLIAAFAYTDEQDGEVLNMMFDYISHLEGFYVYAGQDDHEVKMRIPKHLVALQQIPGLVAATFRRTLFNAHQPSEVKTLIQKLPFNLNPGEAWSDQALKDLAAMPPATRETWMRFLQHANSDKSKPSAAWEKTCAALVNTFPDFQSHVPAWLALVGKPRTHTLFKESYATSDPNDRFDPWNANIVRGLVWALACVAPNEANARACANIVETSLKKVPGVGPRSPKLATAGVVALGRMNTNFAIAQLARLKARVGFKTTLKEIEKALEESAMRAGISKADLEEIAVPTFGLDANGKRTETLGAYRLELSCHNNDVQLTCFDANGKQLKSIPAALKKDFDAELKELKTAQKDIGGMISAIKNRLEKLHISQKTWALHDWQERYMQHPLVGRVAERLIWSIDGHAVATHPERGLEGLRGEKHKFSDTARVALWHPIQASAEEVLAWRNWLYEAGVVQPWKQAHRELYLLTAAEERTRVYSNRFAAHILKQHQFAQLASLRGWNNRLRLMVDDSYAPPTLELPEWNLRAEYWVEGLGDNYGTDTTETGTYLRLMTDQVRFYPLGAPHNNAHAGGGGYEMWLHNGADPVQPLPLDQVPALVLSEVLRDVDLFVGVCSVGNDPTWQDGGPEGRYREYWQSYSFGDLNATAVTRKEMLELLLPRLKIRDRATLEGKFLKIRGDVRSYKIHLGSSNILMEPNDEYLCIVPGAGMDNDRVHLPFEGDRMLALILSKALMLADDTKITDTTITRQLRR